MRISLSIFLLLVACAVGQEVRRATVVEDEPKAGTSDAPVELPPLSHYAKLWTESLFTTRALPAPTAPAGPSFADNLSLSGTYELNGKMVAILIDKTTTSVVEALIGEDNDAGIRITKVEPGATPDSMRIQLQKGTELGWVSFADAAAFTAPPAPAASPANPGVPQAPNPGPAASQVTIPPPAPAPTVPQYAPPPPSSLPGSGITPGINAGMPQAAPHVPDDVPLPPT